MIRDRPPCIRAQRLLPWPRFGLRLLNWANALGSPPDRVVEGTMWLAELRGPHIKLREWNREALERD